MQLTRAELEAAPICTNCSDYIDEPNCKIVRRQRGWVHVGNNSVRCAGQAEGNMRDLNGTKESGAVSPPRKTTPSEQVDEARRLIEGEQVDVERAVPTDHNEPVEGAKPHERPDPPVFEE